MRQKSLKFRRKVSEVPPLRGRSPGTAFLSLPIAVFTAARGGVAAWPGVTVQECDGGNPAWSVPRRLVSILLARRVAAAALAPFTGCMCGRPRRAALDR